MNVRILIFKNHEHLNYWFKQMYIYLIKKNRDILFKCKINEKISYGTLDFIFITESQVERLRGYSENVPKYYEIEYAFEIDFEKTITTIINGKEISVGSIDYKDSIIMNAFAEGLAEGLKLEPQEQKIEAIRNSLFINGKEIENGVQMLEELKAVTRENNELKNDFKKILDNIECTYHCHFDDIREKWNLKREE